MALDKTFSLRRINFHGMCCGGLEMFGPEQASAFSTGRCFERLNSFCGVYIYITLDFKCFNNTT